MKLNLYANIIHILQIHVKYSFDLYYNLKLSKNEFKYVL